MPPPRTTQRSGLGRVEEGVRRAGEGAMVPQKKFFRSRAHINPLNTPVGFEFPVAPERMEWTAHYPAFGDAAAYVGHARPARYVELADVGCGFGGLLMGLAPVLPDTLMLGMEIRPHVTEYVRLRIAAARHESGGCQHLSVVRTNAMKLLPRYFFKGQLAKMFFCFPDPHFKKSNHGRRIISTPLLAEYAYALRPGGLLYTITDVRDLHNWMAAHCDAHPMFTRLSDAELADDPCVPIMRTYTEEGQKVERENRVKYIAVFRRLPDSAAIARAATIASDFWNEVPIDYTFTRVRSRADYTKGGDAAAEAPAAKP